MPVGSAFTNKKLLDPQQQRPYARVSFSNPATSMQSPALLCLVDTGSDWTILPSALAQFVGLNVNGPPIRIRTASGQIQTLGLVKNVPLLIENFTLITDVAFSAAQGFTPIVGRCDLLSTFDIAFDATHWYWG